MMDIKHRMYEEHTSRACKYVRKHALKKRTKNTDRSKKTHLQTYKPHYAFHSLTKANKRTRKAPLSTVGTRPSFVSHHKAPNKRACKSIFTLLIIVYCCCCYSTR